MAHRYKIVMRPLGRSELGDIREIDRTETIRTGYQMVCGELVPEDVVWNVPNWSDRDPTHNPSRIIRGVEEVLDAGGVALGAYAGRRLVGIASYRPRLTPTMGQLDLLQVSAGYRRCGIATRLLRDIVRRARADGAQTLYVSATPSESAVQFYLRNGFRPTAEPRPELLALEPEDIHMIKDLTSEGL